MVGRRLLVVDDSATLCELVELSFSRTGWTTEFASSGREGIAKAAERSPDVILLDYVLPDMRGTDVCAHLARDPHTAHTPIIVMSAKDASVRDLFRAFSSVVDLVTKPFEASEIVACVNRHLARVRSGALQAGATPSGARSTDAPSFTLRQRQTAAQAIYGELRPGLARIPELTSQLGEAAPGPFFARKLLTPAVLQQLLDALVPT